MVTLGLVALVQCHDGSVPVVTIRNGSYQGLYSEQYDQDFFLGMPYAQPPLGSLRWVNPQSLNTTWPGTRNATAYSDICYGFGTDSIWYPNSEDCLTINVVRPAGINETSNLPVAFWIHGGGLVMVRSLWVVRLQYFDQYIPYIWLLTDHIPRVLALINDTTHRLSSKTQSKSESHSSVCPLTIAWDHMVSSTTRMFWVAARQM